MNLIQKVFEVCQIKVSDQKSCAFENCFCRNSHIVIPIIMQFCCIVCSMAYQIIKVVNVNYNKVVLLTNIIDISTKY